MWVGEDDDDDDDEKQKYIYCVVGVFLIKTSPVTKTYANITNVVYIERIEI